MAVVKTYGAALAVAAALAAFATADAARRLGQLSDFASEAAGPLIESFPLDSYISQALQPLYDAFGSA